MHYKWRLGMRSVCCTHSLRVTNERMSLSEEHYIMNELTKFECGKYVQIFIAYSCAHIEWNLLDFESLSEHLINALHVQIQLEIHPTLPNCEDFCALLESWRSSCRSCQNSFYHIISKACFGDIIYSRLAASFNKPVLFS